MLNRLPAALFSALLLALPAQAQDATTTVATVNGNAITLGEVLALYENFQGQAGGMEPQAIFDLIVDQLAQQEALAQQADADPSTRDKAAIALQRRAYMAASALERVAEPEPSDEELHALYTEHFGNAEPVTEYHAAHILVETEEGAEAAAKALADGEDFAKVAAERSTDTTSPNGGDLGWFTLDVMVQPFSEAVAALEPGEVSAPFESPFGWHIAKLIETRVQQPPSFEEVHDDLVTYARRQRVEAAADAALAGAKVERNPEITADILTRIDLLEN